MINEVDNDNLIPEYDESFMLYQIQLLQAFNLETFDDDKINNTTEFLYIQYKENNYISSVINSDFLVSGELKDVDNLTKFRICFGYDTFNLMHSLLCSITSNTSINEDNYKKLLNYKYNT